MGGYGSGRRLTTTLGNIQSCVSLDVNAVFRHDRLAPDRVQQLTWQSARGESIAGMSLRVDLDCVWLSYQVSRADGQTESMQETRGSGQYRVSVGGGATPCSRQLIPSADFSRFE